ncbi:MAG: LytTR family transcriptional regulator [Oscillospiraceae bacterium]|nr:LytTR family transcriptional regulator [Oscillospiraceae bacterium]
MIFRLIIDETKEETVTAVVHARSPLIDRIEELILHEDEVGIPAWTEDGMMLLRFSDIECIFTEDGKTWAVRTDGTRCRLKKRLCELEELLPSSFIRINKSAIANESGLERFAVTFSGAVDAVFRCGYREYVSRRCFAVIRRRFGL